MTAAIEVEELRKSYDEVQALDGVTLSVPKGSFFGFLGPNGAGKTTFINGFWASRRWTRTGRSPCSRA